MSNEEKESASWVILLLGSRNIIGKLNDQKGVNGALSPVYELVTVNIPQRTPDGQMTMQERLMVKPLCNLMWNDDTIHIPPDSIVKLLSDVERVQRKGLLALIAQCEEAVAGARRKASGVEMGDKMKGETSFGGGPRDK